MPSPSRLALNTYPAHHASHPPPRNCAWFDLLAFFRADVMPLCFCAVGFMAVAILRPSHRRHGDGRFVGRQIQAVEKAALAVREILHAGWLRGRCRRHLEREKEEKERGDGHAMFVWAELL